MDHQVSIVTQEASVAPPRRRGQRLVLVLSGAVAIGMIHGVAVGVLAPSATSPVAMPSADEQAARVAEIQRRLAAVQARLEDLQAHPLVVPASAASPRPSAETVAPTTVPPSSSFPSP